MAFRSLLFYKFILKEASETSNKLFPPLESRFHVVKVWFLYGKVVVKQTLDFLNKTACKEEQVGEMGPFEGFL